MCVFASGAQLRSFDVFGNETAVATFPENFAVLFKYGVFQYVLQQFAIASFMMSFYRGNLTETFGDFGETFFVSFLSLCLGRYGRS